MERRNDYTAVIEKYSKVFSDLLANPAQESKLSLGELKKFERDIDSARKAMVSKYRVAQGHAADPMPEVTREEIDQFIQSWNKIDKIVSDAVDYIENDTLGYSVAEKTIVKHIAENTARDTHRAERVLIMYKRSHKEEELPELSTAVMASHKKTLSGISQKISNIFNRKH